MATTTTTTYTYPYTPPTPTTSAATNPATTSTPPIFNPLPLQSRQMRPPKGPLYVPAVLRPTEIFPKSSPPSPPQSFNGSPSSLNDSNNNEPTAQMFRRRSTIDSQTSGISKLAEKEWMKLEHLGQVTGLPTRDHWKVS